MAEEGIVYELTCAEVAECIELIGAAISEPSVTSAGNIDDGVAANIYALANALGWTAEEVAATWATVSAIVDEREREEGNEPCLASTH